MQCILFKQFICSTMLTLQKNPNTIWQPLIFPILDNPTPFCVTSPLSSKNCAGVFLVSFEHISHLSVSIGNFEQVNTDWESFRFFEQKSLLFYMISFFEKKYCEVFKNCCLELCGRLP